MTRGEFIKRELGEILGVDNKSIDVLDLIRQLVEHTYELDGVIIEIGEGVDGHSMTAGRKVLEPIELPSGEYTPCTA